MPRPIVTYVRVVDKVNRFFGRIAMYMIFAMLAVLLYSSISKVFLLPSVWTLEVAQFLMAAYYILGGPYSLQMESHVRMDVFYERWTPRTRAFWDSATAFCLVFYLIFLLRGGISSTAYSLEYGQRNYSAWAPLMWPIKMIMTVGIGLMMLQAFSIFFKDLARVTGREIE